jgi:hypothetical protein
LYSTDLLRPPPGERIEPSRPEGVDLLLTANHAALALG